MAAASIVCGGYDGRPAFIVPTTRAAFCRGLAGNVAVTVVLLVLGAIEFVAEGVTFLTVLAAVGVAFGAYLVRASILSMSAGSDVIATSDELVVRDGIGVLRVDWIDIGSITRFQVWPNWRKDNRMLRVHTTPGRVHVSGAAKRWHPLRRTRAVKIVIYPERHEGGEALVGPLLRWCQDSRNRAQIGTEAGRDAFARSTI